MRRGQGAWTDVWDLAPVIWAIWAITEAGFHCTAPTPPQALDNSHFYNEIAPTPVSVSALCSVQCSGSVTVTDLEIAIASPSFASFFK